MSPDPPDAAEPSSTAPAPSAITPAAIAGAEAVAGLSFDEAEREQMIGQLTQRLERLAELRAVSLPNSVAPALVFNPLPPPKPSRKTRPGARRKRARRAVPADLEEIAFLPIVELAELVRRRLVSSMDLTAMYLARLKRYDPVLTCVVNLTEERAWAQAKAADEELARGRYRGPLHGIPWGAKDLLAVKGWPTTWGSHVYRNRVIDEDATVIQRLDAAGAVLIAKLSVGELAMGDIWHGGTTKNPWNPAQGSSGSSAGPAAATAAGLVGFSVGSETLGSLAHPTDRCGVTALRPTFGRVPRTGAMALAWSMDKLGPICRSVEDCALVFDAIQGPDGKDATVHEAPFVWDPSVDLARLSVGYLKSAFDLVDESEHPSKPFDDAALDVLRSLSATLVPVEIPELPYRAMAIVLAAEAAAAFDELTRSRQDHKMTRQDADGRPNSFRAARFISAVDYVNANRARAIAMERWAALMSTVDVIVTPTFGSQLVATNLTGHPAVIVPNGFRPDGTPVSITFLGRLFEEGTLLAVANAYQEATGFHLRHPALPTP